MKRMITILAMLAVSLAYPLYADYTVENRGAWPENWPKELEPLRKQSRTLEGPKAPYLSYAIPFEKREQFEAVWPHLLSVKSPGAPILLRRGPSFLLGNAMGPQRAFASKHRPKAKPRLQMQRMSMDGGRRQFT